MPLPPGDSLLVTPLNSGADSNRYVIVINYVYGTGGTSAALTVKDGYIIITLTVGFNLTSGANDDWAAGAAAINGVAGAYVLAEGQSGDQSVGIISDRTNGSDGAGLGQYYSATVVVVTKKRIPFFTKGRMAGQGVY